MAARFLDSRSRMDIDERVLRLEEMVGFAPVARGEMIDELQPLQIRLMAIERYIAFLHQQMDFLRSLYSIPADVQLYPQSQFVPYSGEAHRVSQKRKRRR